MNARLWSDRLKRLNPRLWNLDFILFLWSPSDPCLFCTPTNTLALALSLLLTPYTPSAPSPTPHIPIFQNIVHTPTDEDISSLGWAYSCFMYQCASVITTWIGIMGYKTDHCVASTSSSSLYAVIRLAISVFSMLKECMLFQIKECPYHVPNAYILCYYHSLYKEAWLCHRFITTWVYCT